MAKNLWILLCILLFVGCNANRTYERFHTLPAYWHKDDGQRFVFEIKEEEVAYNLVAQFKQDIDYPNYNFYFQYSLKSETDSLLSQELKEVVFFEPKTGKPLGSGIGDTFDHEYSLVDDFYFPGPGTYQVDFHQFMRVDSIPNILRLGLRVEKAQPN